MRIAVVGVPYFAGGGTATRALVKFLQSTEHEVLHFDYYYLGPHTWLQNFIQRSLRWRLGLRYKKWLIRNEFESIVEAVKNARCDVVIAVEQGEILLQNLNGARKIFYAQAPTSHEIYFKLAKYMGAFDWQVYRTTCKNEVEFYRASDSVIFAWNTHAEYVKHYVYQGNNIVLHPDLGWYGCTPQKQRAKFGYPPFIVYMGVITAYWNNAKLLSNLAHSVPYAVHCYGSDMPPAKLELSFQGFADSVDILCNYQFGLHTASCDLVRRQGLASKVLTYLSYGLPSFSPEWQLMSHQLHGVIPYNVSNFPSLLESYLEPTRWQEMADAAYEQAQELEWSKVLQPLMSLFI